MRTHQPLCFLLLAGMLLFALKAEAANSVYISFVPDGSAPVIESEAADKNMKTLKANQIESVAFAIENKTPISSATSGKGSGKATFREISISVPSSTMTNRLFQACVTGAHYTKVTLYFLNPTAASSKPNFTIDLGTVFVSNVEYEASGENPAAKITLQCGSVTLNYAPVDPKTGTLGTTKSVSWSVINNSTDVK